MHASDMRLFAAIGAPVPIREVLKLWSRQIKKDVEFQKWVHPEDYHITVKFLGSTALEKVEPLKRVLAAIAEHTAPFELGVHQVGTFGEKAAPRVLWAGLHGEMDRLSALQQEVEAACRQFGFEPEDRPYRPHITIARKYRGSRALNVGMLEQTFRSHIDQADEAVRKSQIHEMVLYRTHMNREPMYEQIGVFPFGNK